MCAVHECACVCSFNLQVCLLIQHIGVGCDLESSDRADQEAYLSLLRVRALPAQHHQTWANWPNLSQVYKHSMYGDAESIFLSILHLTVTQDKWVWLSLAAQRRPPASLPVPLHVELLAHLLTPSGRRPGGL